MDKMIITFAQERFLGDPTFRALVSWLMGSMRDRYVRSVELSFGRWFDHNVLGSDWSAFRPYFFTHYGNLSLLHVLAAAGLDSLIRCFLKLPNTDPHIMHCGSDDQWMPFTYAVLQFRTETAKLFLDLGADVNLEFRLSKRDIRIRYIGPSMENTPAL
jgi:hypothetical protein